MSLSFYNCQKNKLRTASCVISVYLVKNYLLLQQSINIGLRGKNVENNFYLFNLGLWLCGRI